MKLLDLLQKNKFESIAVELQNLYPEEEENLSLYKNVYEKLMQLFPLSSDMEIVINTYEDDDGESYIQVNGENTKQEDTISYAIEFVPWSEWLGMSVSKDTLEKFSALEILAHCLYEITFISFEEQEIQEVLSDVENKKKEYETSQSSPLSKEFLEEKLRNEMN